MCGEKLILQGASEYRGGSPPRVRGKVSSNCLSGCCTRITPACAGKSSVVSPHPAPAQDHPRVCGEKWHSTATSGAKAGSPPRVRGKESAKIELKRSVGITPACAGKRLKKAHKIKDFDPVPIRFHLVFRRFERWCSNLPTPDGNVPV